MELRKEVQKSPVADEVQALIAVVRPILLGTLMSTKQEAIEDAGGLNQIKLRQVPRIYRPGDGDIGISFEYAVHDAIVNEHPDVLERIDDALKQYCRIKGGSPSSILFGMEKQGSLQIIESVKEHLTNDSRLLSGSRGQPVKLKKHIDAVAAAFRRKTVREQLPYSINGLWKADLFVGRPQPDQWVGTTVKINPAQLQGARGLRLGIVPSRQGKKDAIYRLDKKNLIVVPVPYDDSFMELFYRAWQIVVQFIHADAYVPKEANLPTPADRQVARFLEERRDFVALEVLEALLPMAQPELLVTKTENVSIDLRRGQENITGAIIAPIPNSV
jgi:hypothetical protein